MPTTLLSHLTSGLKDLRHEFLDLVFPPLCLICRQVETVSSQTPICSECHIKVVPPVAQETCLRCAALVGPYTSDETGCPLCRHAKYDFEEVVTLGRYHSLPAESCLRAKQSRNHALVRLLTRMLHERNAARLRDWSADLIIPVPNHWWKRLRRENTAPMWIAYELGRLLKTPVRQQIIIQRKRSKAQHNIRDILLRRRNVRDIYAIRPSKLIEGRTILLVDDIMTSGETLHHVAKLLKAGGAQTIYAAVIARGQGKA